MRLALAALALAACSSPSDGSTSSTGSSDASSTGTTETSSSSSSDSGSSGSSSGGAVSGDETSTSAVDDTSSSGSSTGTTSGGPTDESSSSGSTTAPAPFCGDGEVDDGEECDDGNDQQGDGCAACAWEPWQHEGVAHNIPIADLHGWSQCWTDDYSGTAELPIGSLAESCTKAQLLVACLPVDADTLVLAAHAPREDVMFPVDHSAGERHEANGVAWYWSPNYDDGDLVGFAPAGNTTKCNTKGEDEQLCWKTNVETFSFGTRCGAKLGFTDPDALTWQRIVFER